MNLFDQTTRTRLFVPRRRPDLLSRQRLLDLLLDYLDYKLIIIAAPAGYGKTSLLVDMAHQIEMPVCWYALDPLDRDPQRFITHFIASIALRFPRFGQRSWAALQSGIIGVSDLDRLVSTLVNEACEHIREHFALVLDDYHLVDESEEIGYFVNQFIQQADENCHLIVASRTLLTLPDLPLMVARSQVGGLSFEELAFQADEIQALVLQNHHLTLPGAMAEELARNTEGWITGLLLSTQLMWQGMGDRLRIARVSGVGLYDYLAQQVLDQQPAPIREFLLRTSLMDEFDAELCEAVLGKGEAWSRTIETVLRSNLFVLTVGDKGTWLRYHPLFRDFLQTQLAREYPGEDILIRRRLAAVYLERGQWEKAHAIYQQLGDFEAIAELIDLAGLGLLRGGRLKTLANWLDALPSEILATRPGLLSLRGISAVMLGEVERGLSFLNQAETIALTTEDRPRRARALVWRATAHRFLANYQASEADADEALALAGQNRDLDAIYAEAQRVKGQALFHLGRLIEAIPWLAKSLASYQALDEAQNVAMLHAELGLVYMNAGQYNQSLGHYNHALSYWQKTNNLVWQANLLNNLGVLKHLTGDFLEAERLLEEALTCARQSGYVRIEAFALSSIGDLYADLDATGAAQLAYTQARERARRIDDRFLLLYLDLAEAALSRSQAEFVRAHELLDSAECLAQRSGSDYEQSLYHVERGRLALAEGKAVESIAHLEMATRRLEDSGQRVEAARAHLYLAAAYHAQGNRPATADHIEHSLRLASELESQHTLVVAGREAKGMLAAIPDDTALGRQTTRLLQQIIRFEYDIPSLRRRIRQQASAIPFASPKLTIQTLGRAQVMVNGKPVTNADWQGQVSRDLFFALLAHPEGLSKEALGSIFWPDSSTADLKLKFKNAIYRLRQALGTEVVLFEDERYQFNREIDYQYDVELFVKKINQAQAATDPAEQISAYREAVHLYKGPYLPEVEDEWGWWERERLSRLYREAILKLAELYLDAGDHQTALDYCHQILAEDACLEEAHRLAMRIHAAMGNRAAVVRQFERCRQALLSEVNVAPSAQTVTLYKTLIH